MIIGEHNRPNDTDVNAIRDSIKRLEAASHKMAEAMYSEAADALSDDEK